jgi:Na+/H+ antiporter NhaD/arsenite permease-like protein
MIWKNERARYYVESEVEWWTLLFFMMLFAVAGSLERTGVTQQLALDFTNTFGNNPIVLSSIILFITAIGSAFC